MRMAGLIWSRLLVWAVLLPILSVVHSADAAAACGSSCQCGPGQRCDVSGECKDADKVTSPAAHPLCCTDPDCSPQWLVCEHLDGAIGTCGAAGCTPHGCLAVGKECGQIADGCGGTVDCGTCPAGEECVGGLCDDGCVPMCQGKSCGEDGCGGSCGECQPGYLCSVAGSCELCASDCLNKQCGDDGCGGTCGGCPPGLGCDENFVCGLCSPNCLGKECGDNGCGGSCGSCPGGLLCSPDGLCLSCLPECQNKECGDDGCGGLCGTCGFTEVCSPDGVCLCTPSCLNRECGDNGCGGSCGTCGLEDLCTPEGMCMPEGSADIVESPEVLSPPVDVTLSPDAPETPGQDLTVQDSTPTDCPPGTHLLYGACVKNDEEASDPGGGCSVGAVPSPPLTGSALILVAFALLCSLRRWRGGRP